MISLVPQGDSAYGVFDSGTLVGTVTTSHNPFHAKHVYLCISLEAYKFAAAGTVFQCLREQLGAPLQVMLDSREAELAPHLAAGGCKKMRRCYEMQVTAGDLRFPIQGRLPLHKALSGSVEHRRCCEMQYWHYAKTHEAISPLTAELEEFCRVLPETVVFSVEGEKIPHWAFVEGNEIAYVGTGNPPEFPGFAEALLARMFEESERIFFECDDCDPVSMELRAFFNLPDAPYCDTYIFD